MSCAALKRRARVNIDHGPAKFLLLRQPGYPEQLGPVAFPAYPISGEAGPPTGYGGQASHDYSWFGFIGNPF
jgi:hypothetical protein